MGETHPMTVAQMSPGTTAVITGIAGDDESAEGKLISMGILPGREITLLNVVSEGGPRVVRISRSEIALDLRTASLVEVCPDG